jgi:hypothetical protein
MKQSGKCFRSVYAENQLHFRTEVPLFTKLLAPGLALAEEPDCKFAAVESFGMNRCQIVANGLLEAWQNGDESPERVGWHLSANTSPSLGLTGSAPTSMPTLKTSIPRWTSP